MAADLMAASSTFRTSFTLAAQRMQEEGIDLLAEMEDVAGFDATVDATVATVGLVAVQIGLMDMLTQDFGIAADGFLGHSVGEMRHQNPCIMHFAFCILDAQ